MKHLLQCALGPTAAVMSAPMRLFSDITLLLWFCRLVLCRLALLDIVMASLLIANGTWEEEESLLLGGGAGTGAAVDGRGGGTSGTISERGGGGPGRGGGTSTEVGPGSGIRAAAFPVAPALEDVEAAAAAAAATTADTGGGTKWAAFWWYVGISRLFPSLASKNICSMLRRVVGVKVGVVRVGAPAAEEQSSRRPPASSWLPLLLEVIFCPSARKKRAQNLVKMKKRGIFVRC